MFQNKKPNSQEAVTLTYLVESKLSTYCLKLSRGAPSCSEVLSSKRPTDTYWRLQLLWHNPMHRFDGADCVITIRRNQCLVWSEIKLQIEKVEHCSTCCKFQPWVATMSARSSLTFKVAPCFMSARPFRCFKSSSKSVDKFSMTASRFSWNRRAHCPHKPFLLLTWKAVCNAFLQGTDILHQVTRSRTVVNSVADKSNHIDPSPSACSYSCWSSWREVARHNFDTQS